MAMSIATAQLDFQPVIIIGAARSGTNMLRDALTHFEGVSTWPCDEINAIWRYRRADLGTDELRPRDATTTVRRYVRDSFCKLAERTDAAWIVEKTCANSLRVDFVREILPESKFVFLVRDGRAVVASAVKRWRARFDLRYTLKKARFVPPVDAPTYAVRFFRNRFFRATSRQNRLASWGPRFPGIDNWLATRSLVEVCAQQWSECVLRAAASLARLPLWQVCLVRYESFVARPAEELRRVADFLEIPHCPEQLGAVTKHVSNDSVSKWQQDLGSNEIERVEPIVERTWQSLDRIAHQWAIFANQVS